jgi:hypothetical protein
VTTPLMAGTSLAGTLFGGIAQAFGGYEKGQATQSMYNYQSRVAQINAGVAGEQATAETVAGGIRAEQSGIRTAQRMGETRAGIGAGNLDIGSGSAKQVLSSEAEVGQFEQNTIRNDAARRAYGYRVSAFGDTAQANLDVAAGQGARQAAQFDVGTSILGGATQVSDKWVKFGQEGVFK